MSRHKWWNSKLFALGEIFVSVALGAILSYLKSPWLGIPVSFVLLLVGIGLMWRAYAKRSPTEVQQTSPPPIPTPYRTRSLMPPEDIILSTKMETMVLRNHGHRDEIGIEAEWREHVPWTDMQKGKCTTCGKPRNQKTLKTWNEKGV
jgi:hypothetical protein